MSLDPPDIGDIVRLYDRNSEEIVDASLAVIRISNEGTDNISPSDFQFPITLKFPPRTTIRTVEVTDVHPPTFEQALVPSQGQEADVHQQIVIKGAEVVLPRVNMNAGTRYKVMVVGSGGGGAVEDVRVDGIVVGGDVVNARTLQGRNRRTRRLAAAVVASVSIGALLVAGLVSYGGLRPTPSDVLRCVDGTLVIGGSSAFATAAARVAGSYESYCRNASVRVTTSNSRQGVEQLRDSLDDDEPPQRVALSDGKADDRDVQGLAVVPVAIVPYVIVVNSDVYPTASGPVDLSREQLRKIFDGTQKTWADIDPRFAKLEVKIVARGQSGSRGAFERYVLGDGKEPSGQGAATSSNCAAKDYNAPRRTFLCEVSTTSLVLDRVASLPGAVGYADTPDAARTAGLIDVTIDGRASGLADILDGYPFWTVEYAYRNGRDTGKRSIAVAFLEYLTSTAQAAAISDAGYLPCSSNTALCERR